MFELSTQSESNLLSSDDVYKSMNSYLMNGPYELLQINTMNFSSDGVFCLFQNSVDYSFYGVYSTSDFLKAVEDKKLSTTELSTNLHSHDFYEFLFVLDGEMYQNIEHHRHYYPKGGCCLVLPNTLHSEEYTTKSRVLFFKISENYLHTILSSVRFFASERTNTLKHACDFFESSERYIDFIPKHGYTWVQDNIHSIFEKMVYEFTAPTSNASFKISLQINELLFELFDFQKFSNTPISYGTPNEQILFQAIKEYMINSNRKVSRHELEEHFNYSGDYLYKVVKNQTGLSLYHYNMYICMKKAANLLITTDLNINDIAEAIGFHNFTNFYRVFKTYYKITPREYRLKMR